MHRNTLSALALALLAGALAISAAVAQPPNLLPSAVQGGGSRAKENLDFDNTDFVNVVLGRIKGRYFVGEPVVLPLRLVNHTKHPVTVSTNFIPASKLSIGIRPEEQRLRPWNGPYHLGGYPTARIRLLPLEEVTAPVLVYADETTSNGLAFPAPGRYTITASLKVQVEETQLNGEINIPPFQIEIVPTPPQFQDLVQGIIKHNLAIGIQLSMMNPGDLTTGENLLSGAPPSMLTPLMAFALSQRYILEWQQRPDNKTALERGLLFLKLAWLSDTLYKHDYGMAYLEALDQAGRGVEAAALAHQLVAQLPPNRQGRAGYQKLTREQQAQYNMGAQSLRDKNLLEKYLRDTEELRPESDYWQLFP